MAKELPFFKFEIAEWMFGRIQKQTNDVQGIFINLCCKYWHKLGELTYEDACLDFGEDGMEKLLRSKIIGQDGEYLFIKFLDKQLEECEKLKKENSIKGLKSAQIRTARKQQSTAVQPQLNSVQPISTEENRREEIRVEENTHGIKLLKALEVKEEIEKKIKEAFELDTTGMEMNWARRVDYPMELQAFKEKVRVSPEDYIHHTVNGLLKAFNYQLRNATSKPNINGETIKRTGANAIIKPAAGGFGKL